MAWKAITQKKARLLAYQVAFRSNGCHRQPNNHEKGQARKIVEAIVEQDPAKYLEFHPKYCTPKDEVIIEDACKIFQADPNYDPNQGRLF